MECPHITRSSQEVAFPVGQVSALQGSQASSICRPEPEGVAQLRRAVARGSHRGCCRIKHEVQESPHCLSLVPVQGSPRGAP